MIFIAALALMALALSTVIWLRPGVARTNSVPDDRRVAQEIGRLTDSLVVMYGIGPAMLRSWHVSTIGNDFVRFEERAYVEPGFLGIQFNHDLSRLMTRLGARVCGTERAKESILKLHIVWGGLTMRSISFEPKPRDHR